MLEPASRSTRSPSRCPKVSLICLRLSMSSVRHETSEWPRCARAISPRNRTIAGRRFLTASQLVGRCLVPRAGKPRARAPRHRRARRWRRTHRFQARAARQPAGSRFAAGDVLTAGTSACADASSVRRLRRASARRGSALTSSSSRSAMPIARAIDAVGDAWALPILRETCCPRGCRTRSPCATSRGCTVDARGAGMRLVGAARMLETAREPVPRRRGRSIRSGGLPGLQMI